MRSNVRPNWPIRRNGQFGLTHTPARLRLSKDNLAEKSGPNHHCGGLEQCVMQRIDRYVKTGTRKGPLSGPMRIQSCLQTGRSATWRTSGKQACTTGGDCTNRDCTSSSTAQLRSRRRQASTFGLSGPDLWNESVKTSRHGPCGFRDLAPNGRRAERRSAFAAGSWP